MFVYRPKGSICSILLLLLCFSVELSASGNGFYRINCQGGLERKMGTRWIRTRGEGLPLRWLYPFESQEIRPLTGVASTNACPLQVLVCTSDGLYLSKDAGDSFICVAKRKELSYTSYFTCLAISESNPDEWIVGTSFNGFHITRNAGRSWCSIKASLIPLRYGGAYYDTINDMVYSLCEDNKLYFTYGVHGKVALLNTLTGNIELETYVPDSCGIVGLEVKKNGDEETLKAFTETTTWALRDNKWKRVALIRRPNLSSSALRRRNLAQEKKGIYLTAWSASDLNKLKKYFEFIKSHGMNSVVIDFKDDSGYVMWDSLNPLARKIKAIRPILKVKDILELAHEMDIYVIARFVVFKDQKLYDYQGGEYTLWDKRSQSAWVHLVGGKQREFWVDLFCSDVWEYNSSLAKELQDLGVDEIQFDYIRFPSDGTTATIISRHNPLSLRPVDALESFLKRVRSEISIPLSVDIFGYNGWFLTDSLGQNMERLSLYVDAISPMTYPSHYDEGFLGFLGYLEKARFLYQEGCERTDFYTKGRIIVRQYVQAFLLGKERNFSEKTYYNYLEEQIKGIKCSVGSGWILWNASNNYYMIK